MTTGILTAPALIRTGGWPCPDCDGMGAVQVRTCGHGTGHCPCVQRPPVCGSCHGEAVDMCGFCGVERAEVESGDTRYCMDCYEGEV